MKTSYSIWINATPERVFYWLDDPDRVMAWLPNIIENENLEVTDDRVGSTFRQVYEERGRRMEMFGTVTAYEVDRQMTLEIESNMFNLFVDYRLEHEDEGTRLTQNSRVQFKGFLKLLSPLFNLFSKKAGERALESSFQKLKNLAESDQD